MKASIKKLIRRWLSMLLVFVMCFGMLNLTAFASEGKDSHTHNEDGWICTQGEGGKVPICGEHQHDEGCYEVGSECALQEHEHSEACFETELVWLCGTDAHAHDDSCYTVETGRGELLCETGEHAHSGECFGEDDEPVCAEAEHAHDDGCYAVVTGRGELLCEIGEHTHSADDCEYRTEQGDLACTQAEHTHGDTCVYETVAICDDPGSDHVHGDDCFAVTEGEWTCVWAGGLVYSEAELKQAIETAGTEKTTITLAGSFDAVSFIQIKAGQDITLVGGEGAVIGRASSCTSSFVWVNGSLTLRNIVVDGKNVPSSTPAVYIASTGAFTMEEGAVIRNNLNDYSTQKYYGGGVYNNGGTFVMNGGSITGNTANSYGGGVANGGTFTMNGGEISGNTNPTWYGGGVWNSSSGTFEMTNGTISGNTASNASYGYGAGVYNAGAFTAADSTISNNNSMYGGGGVTNTGEATLNNSSITGSSAYGYGGGVYNSGTFTMNGGEISGNENTRWYGGGVYNSGTFTMTGGAISGNKATNASYGYGGGMYNVGTFTSVNGGISGNTGAKFGGGVYSTMPITMTGTKVSGNNVGAIYINSSAVGLTELKNLTITGNTGNQPALYSSTIDSVTVDGCAITGNTVTSGSAVHILGGNTSAAYKDTTYAAVKTVSNSTISGNSVKEAGLRLAGYGAGYYVTNCAITGNTGGTYGGVYSMSASANIFFDGTLIANNTGTSVGGLSFSAVEQYSITLTDTVIKHNTATGASGVGGISLSSRGPLVYASGALYGNTGVKKNSTGYAANDFYANSEITAYTLLAANEMVDPDNAAVSFAGEQYIWQGVPSSLEGAGQRVEGYKGELYLTAMPSVERNAAKIGETEYATLAEAVEAADDNAVIEVTFGEDGFGTEMSSTAAIEITKPVTIKFNGQTFHDKSGSESADLFVVEKGGSLTLQGTATLYGTITVKEGGSLTMDGGIVSYANSSLDKKALTVDVKAGSSFTITGQMATVAYYSYPLQVNLAKGTYITAGEGFAINNRGIQITLDDEIYDEFNNAGFTDEPDDVTLIADCGDENVPSKITFGKAFTNALVAVVAESGNIVLHKNVVDEGILLGPGKEYTTFADAKQAAIDQGVDTIYVTGEMAGSGEWDGKLGEGKKNLTLVRDPSYHGILVRVTSSLTLSNITLDGGSSSTNKGVQNNGPLVYAQSGTLILNSGTVLQNNDVSKNTSGPLYPSHGGGINILGGKVVMNRGATIENCRAEYGGAVAITAHGGHMTMNGGTIRGNSATVSGGGMAASIAYNAPQFGNVLDVMGGTFAGNHADVTGGAIYVQSSNGITIGSPGSHNRNVLFTGNSADGGNRAFAGGALYVNGGTSGYVNGRAQLYNVVITNNTSTGTWGGYQGGGGIAGCLSANITIYLTNGAAIYGNNGPNGSNDILTTSINHTDGLSRSGSSKIEISPEMLGGGAYNWRYTSNGRAVPLDALSADRNLAVYSGASGSSIAKANSLAGVVFESNTGNALGGAIGTNGDIVIGTSGTPSETTSLYVEKIWVEEGDEPIQHGEIEVEILRYVGDSAEAAETFTSIYLNEENGWKGGIDKLPKADKAGNKYTYTVKEAKVPDGYSATVEDKAGEAGYEFACTITNAYTPETPPPPPPTPEYGSLMIVKAVVGGGDAAANKTYTFDVRDASGTVVATVTITGAGTATVTGLSAGTYTVTERDAAIDGFTWTCEITGSGEVRVNATATVVVTNIYESEPGPELVEVTVSKVWEDDNDSDGIRPGSVEVQLYQGDNAYGEAVILNADNGWTYTWTGLDSGYEYRVVEVGVPEGYTESYEQTGTVWIITNTHEPEEDEEFDIPEDDVPLSPGPGDDDLFDIPEDDVPLASVPQTGDNSGIWLAITAMSAMGLALLALTGKRKKEDKEA